MAMKDAVNILLGEEPIPRIVRRICITHFDLTVLSNLLSVFLHNGKGSVDDVHGNARCLA
jgi:hypothetical protein